MSIIDPIIDLAKIWMDKFRKAGSTPSERAELRINELVAELTANQRALSSMRGELNHENDVLSALQSDVGVAEADYKLLAKQPGVTEDELNDALDKVAEAERTVALQKTVVETVQKAFDTLRFGVAKAAAEVKKIQGELKSKQAIAKATATLTSTAKIIDETRNLAKDSSEITSEFNEIDKAWERAKARLEDASGNETERKLEEAREKQRREEIRKRLENKG